MRIFSVLALLFYSQLIFCQIPEKEQILDAYYVGHKAFEALQLVDIDLIDAYFKDTTNLAFMVEGIDSNKFHEDSTGIRKDVLYNQKTKRFEFMVYAGNHIPSDDDWGLYDYDFVILMDIDMSQEGREKQILNTTIIKDTDEEDLILWWRRYMRTYEDPDYARKEIFEKHDLMPPPPPPPESKDWL